MISSMTIACFPYTFPTRCIDPIFPGPSRCFMIIARLTFLKPLLTIISKKAFARLTPPASGDTTTDWSRLIADWYLKQLMATCTASRLSQGTQGLKKPCSWPECRSMTTTRSTPTVSRSRATSAAEMGTLGADFLSCLAQPQQGMTTLIFPDEALRMVETMSSSSISDSLTGGQVGCTMKMCLPLTFYLTQMLTSPSRNLPTFISPSFIFRILAISEASAWLEFPVKINTSLWNSSVMSIFRQNRYRSLWLKRSISD